MNLSYATWLTVSGVVALLVAGSAWKRRSAPVAPALFALMISLAFWSLTYAVSWVVPSDAAGIFWLKLTYLGAATAPLAFFVLVLYFVDRYAWLTRKAYSADSHPGVDHFAVVDGPLAPFILWQLSGGRERLNLQRRAVVLY